MPLSRAELSHLERRLLQERTRVVTALRALGQELGESGRSAAGDLSAFPLHPADLGTDAFAREVDASVETRLSRELSQIERALQRMYDDPERFGRDEHDGEEIPFERLDLIPWARRRVHGSTGRAT